MQQLQHKQFTIMQAGMQVWSALSAITLRHSYVPVGSGFTAIENKTNDDRTRPWFEQ